MIGDLLTRAGQIEIGESLLIGAGTRYPISAISGLGIPSRSADDRPRGGAHGSVPSPEYLPGRDLVATLGISGVDRSALTTLTDALAAEWHPLADPEATVPLAVWLGAGARILWVRPRPLDLPWDDWTPWGLARQVVASAHAPDPVAYALTEDTDTVTIAASATSGTANLTVGGNTRTAPTLTITGPATNPRVANAAAAAEIRLSVILTAVDVVTIDVATRTVLLNGVEDYSIVAADNEWWNLEPGTNGITYTRDDAPATASTVDIVRRDGYLTAV